ncbi:MAG: hypothetical protein WCQ47_05535 [bacterium]
MKLYVIKRALVLMTLLSSTAFASTVMGLSDEDIIARAQYIMKGTVSSIYTTIEKAGTPFQYITIDIQKLYKNDPSSPLYELDKIVIRQMGGTANNVTLDIDSLQKFTEGSEVFVSVKQDRNGYYYVIGNSQGLYKIVNEKLINNTQDAGTAFVRQGESGQIVFEPGKIKEIKMEQMQKKLDAATSREEF